MNFDFKDTRAELSSFRMNRTYDGEMEGTRSSCTRFMLEDELRKMKKKEGYLYVDMGFVSDHGHEAFRDWNYKALFNTMIGDEVYRLEISFYADEIADCSIRSLLEPIVKDIPLLEKAFHYDLLDL